MKRYKVIDIGKNASTEEIVEALAKNKIVEQIVSSIIKNIDNDLAQDIYIQLLIDKEKTKLLYLEGQLQYYIVGIIRNSVFSKSSQYYYKYKRFLEKSIDIFPNI